MHLTLFAVFKTLVRAKEIEIKHWSLSLQRSALGLESSVTVENCNNQFLVRCYLCHVLLTSQRFTFFESIDLALITEITLFLAKIFLMK